MSAKSAKRSVFLLTVLTSNYIAMPRVKTIRVKDAPSLSNYPNFSKTGSVKGMKKLYYGKDALLVRCGSYIYNVTSSPEIYYNLAH